ncbi:MAG: PQQ-dependent sugar dehydrogenase [Tetrasphaera sp.]|nr:PQQ-dependent sugar dehydrogenase [Tetrasphaera sp.]
MHRCVECSRGTPVRPVPGQREASRSAPRGGVTGGAARAGLAEENPRSEEGAHQRGATLAHPLVGVADDLEQADQVGADPLPVLARGGPHEVDEPAEGIIVEGTVAPHYVWEVSPAISGMAFYTNSRFPAWQSSLFVGALKQQALIRLTLDGDRIVGEERLLTDRNQRIRDVRAGPDGYLYVLTDGPDGQLLRVGL